MIAGTARGFRDILPQEALARERITNEARECFSAHGYLPVETPLLEDRAALERGGRLKDSPFQLFDTDGTLLVLRPDLTLPVARLVAGRVDAGSLPARFRYAAPSCARSPRCAASPASSPSLAWSWWVPTAPRRRSRSWTFSPRSWPSWAFPPGAWSLARSRP